MAKIRVKSDNRMSNTRYHASGKPCWWIRIGDTFLDIPRVRGDEYLDVTIDVDRHPTERIMVYYGVGPKDRHGVRESMYVRSKAEVAAAKAAKEAKQE